MRISLPQRFSRAAATYETAARLPRATAKRLMTLVTPRLHTPPRVALDVGCGTGFLADEIAQRWPRAVCMALDPAEAMTREALRLRPWVLPVVGDGAVLPVRPASVDVVLSNLVLHWLNEPEKAVAQWRTCLTPGGLLAVALLVAGSFREWAETCERAGVSDSLWPTPSLATFASFDEKSVKGASRVLEDRIVVYPSARTFLASLRDIGADSPRPGQPPLHAGVLRRILRVAPRPFPVTHRVLYLVLPAEGETVQNQSILLDRPFRKTL